MAKNLLSPYRMPVLFIGHGSPMNAVQKNIFSENWRREAMKLPKPTGILCISAHWETPAETAVSSSEHPPTIHDFYGFPKELFDVRYSAPGDPVLARRAASLIKKTKTKLDAERGLDHGVWSVLKNMYPEADIPVVQLSIDSSKPAAFHYELAKDLTPLRNEGILIMGSGNMVHNLGLIRYEDPAGFEWAARIDEKLKSKIMEGDHDALTHYYSLDREMLLAVPSNEHFLPLLYVLALKNPVETVSLFNEGVIMGSISMTSLRIG